VLTSLSAAVAAESWFDMGKFPGSDKASTGEHALHVHSLAKLCSQLVFVCGFPVTCGGSSLACMHAASLLQGKRMSVVLMRLLPSPVQLKPGLSASSQPVTCLTGCVLS
jgi:hypothetical protein